MKKNKESQISRSFITATALVYALIIIIIAVSFNYIMKKHSSLLNDIITDLNSDHMLEKTDLAIDRLSLYDAAKTADIKNLLKDYCTAEKGFLYVIMYSKTEDDNYFKIIDTLQVSKRLDLGIKKRNIVKEIKEENYLKQALIHSIVEPRRYHHNKIPWQNTYAPYKLNNKTIILQFLMSTEKSEEAASIFTRSYFNIRLIFTGISAVLVIAVIIISLIFSHSVSLLITNLSLFLEKAASGEHDINLKASEDAGLNQLALSFNSLMDELKEKSDTAKTDPLLDIFKEGVRQLKEDNTDDAIAIFRTLAILKPGSFGSFFNLGIAYAKKRQYLQSLAMFKTARNLNPEHDLTDRYIERVERFISAHHGT